MYHCAGLPRP